MSPRFLSLPAETVGNICDRLPSKDFASFRLTCRTLEEKSFNCVLEKDFTTEAYTISLRGLKQLADISTSRLGPSIRNLKIRYTIYWEENIRKGRHQAQITDVADYLEHARPPYAVAFWAYCVEQNRLAAIAPNLLRSLLVRFISLRSVTIEGRYSVMSHLARSFDADPTLLFETVPDCNEGDYDEPSAKQQLVLAALCDTGVCLRSLKIISYEGPSLDDGLSSDDGSSLDEDLVLQQSRFPRFISLASNIESLSLSLQTNDWFHDDTDQEAQTCTPTAMRTFFSHMKGLRKLCLKFGYGRPCGKLLKFTKSCLCPRLEVLQLEGMDRIDEEELLTSVSHHYRTLRRLELRDVTLYHCTWTSFFEHLASTPLQLKYIDIRSLNGYHVRDDYEQKKEIHDSVSDLLARKETLLLWD